MPDAAEGGARSREEALADAERAAGQPLVELEAQWVQAYRRVLAGQPAFPRAAGARRAGGDGREGSERHSGRAPGSLRGEARPTAASIWTRLGLRPGAAVDDIKQAFRSRVLAAHPDHGGTAEEFMALHHAYREALARSQRPSRKPSRSRR